MAQGEKQKVTGTCVACQQSFPRSGLTKHLEHCESRNQASERASGKERLFKGFHLLIEGRWERSYFLHVHAAASARLSDLDSFLRHIWLECCGHLSLFEIEGENYSVSPNKEFDDKEMAIPLDAVLRPKLKFRYEYDFGSTTELTLQVISESQGVLKKKIELLARNDIPEIPCGRCGKPVTEICAECAGEKEAMLCPECVKKHSCNEEMLLPFVNSPRAGVCGYTG